MNIIIAYLFANILLGGSIILGFVLTSKLIVVMNQEDDISDNDKEGIHLYSFLEELENEPMSYLEQEQLEKLKNVYVCLNLGPLKNQDVRMCYDSKRDQFIYYSESDLIYKYLNIVARHYVITHHCKQIYTELEESILKTVEEKTITGPFVSKRTEKKLLEKKHLHFLYKGNYNDFIRDRPEITSEKKKKNILEFMKLQKQIEDYETIMKEE